MGQSKIEMLRRRLSILILRDCNGQMKREVSDLGVNRGPRVFYLRILSVEIDIKLFQMF